jgi:zinc transport system substrate-binding protein
MLKKILAAALAPLFAFLFLSGAEASDGKKLKVVATIFPQYDFVRAIAGDAVDLSMLLRPGAESHSFDPTPRDMRNIDGCDLFIYVGGESDDWARNILGSLGAESKKKLTVVSLMDIVETVEEELVEGMEEDEEASDEPEYDEHVWTSPKNASLLVASLAETLCQLDESNAALYRQNAASYQKELDALDKTFESVVKDAKRRTVVFGDRFPFRYFADAYGLDYYAAFPGCSTETEASAATIAFLIDKTKAEGIPVVFYREFSNADIARAICESTGAKSMLFHSCHNISRDEFSSGVTYVEIMRRNADNLREALY